MNCAPAAAKSELFNFGGTIEEIKARCKAETHLDPPQAPTFIARG